MAELQIRFDDGGCLLAMNGSLSPAGGRKSSRLLAPSRTCLNLLVLAANAPSPSSSSNGAHRPRFRGLSSEGLSAFARARPAAVWLVPPGRRHCASVFPPTVRCAVMALVIFFWSDRPKASPRWRGGVLTGGMVVTYDVGLVRRRISP